MKKKTLFAMAILCMTVAMSACGSNKNIATADEEIETYEDDAEAEEDLEDLDLDEDWDEEEYEEEVEESTPALVLGDYNLDDYTEDFVNFDEMAFYVNGKKYVLGQTTLQEMIDDGVPFDEDVLAVAEEILEPDYESAALTIVLDDYWSARIHVFNEDGEDKKTADCYVNTVYFPNDLERTQNIISFNFPLNITMDDLIARAGEPDKNDHYDSEDSDYYSDTIEYSQTSEKYYGNSYYTFEFVDSALSYLTITYTP